jgi:uncharacterized protein (DUF2147 family)
MVTRSYGQKDPIEKVWWDGDKGSKIEIYLAKNGTYCGRIIWLKDSIDTKTGKPMLDNENPDEKLRHNPVKGLVLMQGFKKNPDNKDEYTGGSIYDPKKGKTYCGKITLKGKVLDLRGYICSFSIFGRTEVWEMVEGQ